MGRPDQFSSLFWFLLGLAVIFLSYRLGLGTLTSPGPGFLPLWCGLILSAISLGVFFHRLLIPSGGESQTIRKLWGGVHWLRGVFVVSALLVYTLLFTHLGYLLSTLVLLLFLFKAIEPQGWTVAIGGAVLASFISFVVFALWLDVQLPRGILERFLF
jgi:putative tricarboxylic transport membrane protein